MGSRAFKPEDWLDKQVAANYFAKPTLEVARTLLGKLILFRPELEKPFSAFRIVETEAYFGEDPASHSYRGITPRTEVMFGEPGRAYVYFIYGMYEMLNFVTEPEGKAGAVLIRACEPVFGVQSRLNGPGKLTRALGITRKHNRERLTGPYFYVIDDGFRVGRVLESPRVGISKGQESFWRFMIEGHPDVSPAKENKLARRMKNQVKIK